MNGKLSDILNSIGGGGSGGGWDSTDAAGEHEPLPPGEYEAVITKGEVAENPKTQTPSYKLTFRVETGEHTGRRFWHDLYLTRAALPYTKRDLLKLGITDPAQLERPLPHQYRCRVKLALRRTEDGGEFNRVVRFDVLGTVAPDAFSPKDGVK